jgi:hypothetical protein
LFTSELGRRPWTDLSFQYLHEQSATCLTIPSSTFPPGSNISIGQLSSTDGAGFAMDSHETTLFSPCRPSEGPQAGTSTRTVRRARHVSGLGRPDHATDSPPGAATDVVPPSTWPPRSPITSHLPAAPAPHQPAPNAREPLTGPASHGKGRLNCFNSRNGA